VLLMLLLRLLIEGSHRGAAPWDSHMQGLHTVFDC